MTFALVLAGVLLLAAGTRRQARLLPASLARPGVRRTSLACGYGLLLLAAGQAVTGADGARAIVQWFGDLTLGALLAVGLIWRLGAPD